ncbi:MAG: lysophospholipid acyltransferase family protein [Verrucomicrobiota bacterium]
MINYSLAQAVRLFTGAHGRWVGCLPTTQQRVYFANHTSNLDFLGIWSTLPEKLRNQTRPVAAHDYWTSGVLKNYLAEHVFRALLIERKRVTKTNNPLSQMFDALEQGDSLIIFPEGGRSMTGELRPFKSGLFRIAQQFPDIELIPVYIENLNRVLPKGEVLPLPIVCSITFGSTLKLQPQEPKDVFLRRAERSVQNLMPYEN